MRTIKWFTIIGFVLVTAFSAGLVGAQDTAPRLWLSSDVAQAAPGDLVTVQVHVADMAQVYGGSFRLSFDPAALEVVLVENQVVVPGDFFGAEPSFLLKNSADAQNGAVEYALTLTQPAQPVSGEGVLGTVTFRARTQTTVNITPVEASLVSPEFTEVDGRLIAQRINTVQAQLAPMVIAGAGSLAVVSASLGVRPATPAPVIANDVKTYIIAGGLLISGGALLLLSLMMYARMRSSGVPRYGFQPE